MAIVDQGSGDLIVRATRGDRIAVSDLPGGRQVKEYLLLPESSSEPTVVSLHNKFDYSHVFDGSIEWVTRRQLDDRPLLEVLAGVAADFGATGQEEERFVDILRNGLLSTDDPAKFDAVAAASSVLLALDRAGDVADLVRMIDFESLGAAHQAILRSVEAKGAHELGDMSRSIELGNRALELFRFAGRNSPALRSQLAQTTAELCDGYTFMGDTARGESCLHQAIKLARGHDDILAFAHNNLGGHFSFLHDLRSASKQFRMSAEISERIGWTRKQAQAIYNLGGIHLRSGRLDLAKRSYFEALDLLSEENLPSLEIYILTAIGQLYLDSSNLGAAERYLTSALGRSSPKHGRRIRAAILSRLASVHRRRGQFDLAISLQTEEVEYWKQLSSENTHYLALAYVDLGRTLLEKGDSEGAYRSVRAALAIADNDRAFADAVFLRARIEAKTSRLDDAIRSAKQALRTYSELNFEPLIIDSSYFLAELYLGLENYEQALEYSSRTIDNVERLKRTFEDAPIGRELIASMGQSYHQLAGLLLARNDVPAALAVSERKRKAGRLDAYGRLTPDQLVELRKANRAFVDAINRGDLKAAARHRSEVDRIDALRGPSAFPAIASPVDFDPAGYPNEVAFLQFLLGEPQSFAFAFVDRTLTVKVLPGVDELSERVSDALTRLRSPNMPYREALIRLSEEIIPPEVLASEPEKIVVSADGALHYLPFAALSARTDSYLPLVAVTAIEYVHSLTDYAESESTYHTVAVVAPDQGSEFSSSTHLDGASRDWARTLSPLPWAAKEALGVLNSFDDERSVALLGSAASFEGLEVVSGADVIHFATHGLFSDVVADEAGLALSNPSGEREFVGWRELRELDLRSELVVLSACETALGTHLDGFGVQGLRSAFLGRGARRVLTALWNIGDRSSHDMMLTFYSSLLSGMPSVDALRNAQLDIRSNRRFSHPFHWSGFVLHSNRRAEGT